MGPASSEAAEALANEAECIVEVLPKVSGGFIETIHYLSDL